MGEIHSLIGTSHKRIRHKAKMVKFIEFPPTITIDKAYGVALICKNKAGEVVTIFQRDTTPRGFSVQIGFDGGPILNGVHDVFWVVAVARDNAEGK